MVLLPLLIPLTLVLGFVVLLGMNYTYRQSLGVVLRGIATWLGNVTVNAWIFKSHPLRFLESQILKLDHAIQNSIGRQLGIYDRKVGTAVSASAALVGQVGFAVEYPAIKALQAFQILTQTAIPAAARLGQATGLKALHGIDEVGARAKARERAIASGFATGIDRLRKDLTKTVTKERARARTAEATLRAREKAIGKDLAKVKTKLGIGVLTGLVVVALTRFLGSWIKCPSLRRIGKRVGCGGFAFLEGLLALSFEAMVVTDLCQVTKAMQTAAKAFVPAFEYLAGHIPGLIACQGAARPKPLRVKRYALPPVSTSLDLSSGV